jgi:hypothetical protein
LQRLPEWPRMKTPALLVVGSVVALADPKLLADEAVKGLGDIPEDDPAPLAADHQMEPQTWEGALR